MFQRHYLDIRRIVWSLEHLESLRYIRTIKEIILHIDHFEACASFRVKDPDGLGVFHDELA